MEYLTGDIAFQARQELGLSQSKVAKETGINRAYLSEFEGDKRVLSESQLKGLSDYLQQQGWSPTSEQSEATVEELINHDKCGLTIRDGFVVVQHASEHDVEELLGEYYALDDEIEGLCSAKVIRGMFGIDDEEAIKQGLQVLLCIARRSEILNVLQGRTDALGGRLDISNEKTLISVGDYVNALLSNHLPDRYLVDVV